MPAVERVVELLGHLEEFVVALYHVPACVHAELRAHRYHAAEDLGNAAAAEGGVDVLDNLAGELIGKITQFVDGALPDDRLVIGDVYFIRFSTSCISADLSPSRLYVYGSSLAMSPASPASSRFCSNHIEKSLDPLPSLILDSNTW